MIEKVFRDPVHDYIKVQSSIIEALIDSKEFQRLRRIKQLGMGSFTFHGAEHSRFSHSLGAYEVARRVTERFEKHYSTTWSEENSFLTMVAALLHDLGHGAYSHTFETLFDTNHENMTIQIITSPETEVNHILKKVAPHFPDEVASVINHEHPNKAIVALISSQLDVDRMDYLLRDSYFTGASYGRFDLTHILRNLAPTDSGIICHYKGMHAVEDYIIRRFQMYVQVYFHPASRAAEGLLQNLLKRAKTLFKKEPDFFEKTAPKLLPFLAQDVTLSDYLQLDDGVLTTYFQEWTKANDAILADLASRFLNRCLFKSVSLASPDHKLISQLQELVAAAGFEPRYYTFIHESIDLPYDSYDPKAQDPKTQIDILQKDGSVVELSTISTLIRSLSGQKQSDYRFYFPKEMLSQDQLFHAISSDF